MTGRMALALLVSAWLFLLPLAHRRSTVRTVFEPVSRRMPPAPRTLHHSCTIPHPHRRFPFWLNVGGGCAPHNVSNEFFSLHHMANIHYIESTTQNTLRFRFQFFAHAPPAQRRRQVLSRLGNFLCRNTRYCTGSAFRSILRGQCIQPSLFSPSLIVTLSSTIRPSLSVHS